MFAIASLIRGGVFSRAKVNGACHYVDIQFGPRPRPSWRRRHCRRCVACLFLHPGQYALALPDCRSLSAPARVCPPAAKRWISWLAPPEAHRLCRRRRQNCPLCLPQGRARRLCRPLAVTAAIASPAAGRSASRRQFAPAPHPGRRRRRAAVFLPCIATAAMAKPGACMSQAQPSLASSRAIEPDAYGLATASRPLPCPACHERPAPKPRQILLSKRANIFIWSTPGCSRKTSASSG